MGYQKALAIASLIFPSVGFSVPPPHPNICSSTACFEISPTELIGMKSELVADVSPLGGAERIVITFARMGTIEVHIDKPRMAQCAGALSNLRLTLGDGNSAKAEGYGRLSGPQPRCRRIELSYHATSNADLRFLVDSLSMLWLIEGPPEHRSEGLVSILGPGLAFQLVSDL